MNYTSAPYSQIDAINYISWIIFHKIGVFILDSHHSVLSKVKTLISASGLTGLADYRLILSFLSLAPFAVSRNEYAVP